jgi:hypothetical protein
MERRENPLRFASGRPFAGVLVTSGVSMASISRNACGSNNPIGIERFRAAPWVASLLELS